MPKLHHYAVITPEYGEVVPILDDGTGPMEYGCDCVEVLARNKRDALLLGVKYMRSRPREYKWFKYDDENPFAGVKVECLDGAPGYQELDEAAKEPHA